MHINHGDIHVVGLVDSCESCTYLADNPLANLDKTMLTNLCVRNFGYRFGRRDLRAMFEPRSYTEAVAMANITNVMEKMGKLWEVAPNEMADYLEQRWNINFDDFVKL